MSHRLSALAAAVALLLSVAASAQEETPPVEPGATPEIGAAPADAESSSTEPRTIIIVTPPSSGQQPAPEQPAEGQAGTSAAPGTETTGQGGTSYPRSAPTTQQAPAPAPYQAPARAAQPEPAPAQVDPTPEAGPAPIAEQPPPYEPERRVVTEPQEGLQAVPGDYPPVEDPAQAAVVPEPRRDGAYLDGQRREGAFLSGPGSMVFVLHHTLMGAAGGLATQGVAHGFDLSVESRTAMLAGTLIGAGVGFASSAWWQFNHWIDSPMAVYGIVNTVAGGLFAAGVTDLFTNDALALAWASFIGAELGAWLTAAVGGGQMPLKHGLLMASGAAWGAAYSALLLAILGTTGTRVSSEGAVDTLAISTGAGALLMALATLRYEPTAAQIVRADLFGAGVGGAVLVLSAIVLGFDFKQPTPYILGMVGSAGAIAAVSLLWEEAAEVPAADTGAYFYRGKDRDLPYRNVWW